MTTSEQLHKDFDSMERAALRVKGERDALLVVAKRVLAELGDIYDCELHVDGSHRESPFSGAGELMTSLRTVVERAERP